MAKKLQENKFDMDDLLDQLRNIKKMGSIKSIMSMIPGVGDKLKDIDVDDKQFVRIEAMITSMTKEEKSKTFNYKSSEKTQDCIRKRY